MALEPWTGRCSISNERPDPSRSDARWSEVAGKAPPRGHVRDETRWSQGYSSGSLVDRDEDDARQTRNAAGNAAAGKRITWAGRREVSRAAAKPAKRGEGSGEEAEMMRRMPRGADDRGGEAARERQSSRCVAR
jgi:hypothetical protein